MKKHQLFQLALGLLLSHTGMAQVKTHYWTTKDQVAVTIDRHTGYAYVDGSKSPLIPTGNITVKPGADVSIDLLIEIAGGDLSIVKAGRHGTYLLRPQNGQDVFDIANRIYESGHAQWAFPEFIIEVAPFQNDPLYANQYYLHNTGQNGGTAGMDIKAPQAWQITTGVNKVKVAVIDTGVEPHEDLEETTLSGTSSRVLPGYDPLDPTNPGLPTSNLWYRGHGESVSGIIGASHNALGVAGVSPCSNVTPVNIFGPAGNTSTSLAEAIDWAWDQGQADVLNNSWGYGTCGIVWDFPDINQAILNARTLGRNGKGCAVVFASGNMGCEVSYPANVPGVITVGALDRNGNLTTYSNSGPETDVVAFGGYADIVTTDLTGTDGFSAGDYTSGFDGTSAACPQVAGALALMLSANPDLTEAQLTQLLHSTATDMGASGFDNTFGYGRLNVEAAVRAALPLIAGPVGVSDMTSSTYSVPQQPGTTVTWQAEPAGLFLNAQATGAAASFTAEMYPSDLGQQCGTISATITGPCGSVTLSKPIVVYPGATDFRGQIPPCPATGGGGGNPTSRMAPPVSAYPNPANDRLTLPQGTGKAVLLNTYGKVVQYPDATGQFDVRSLPAGLYNLQIQQDGKLSNQHIEVQH
jgi:hypothetical protein